MKLLKIIYKNLKLLMRSKSSLFTTLIGPLVIVALIGVAFSNISSYSINIGIYSNEYTPGVNSFIEGLDNGEYKILKYPMKDVCLNEIKKGTIHTCIFFPDNFEVGNDAANTLELFVDETNVNVVSMVKQTISDQINSQTSDLTTDLTGDVLDRIGNVQDSSASQAKLISEMIDYVGELTDDLADINSDLKKVNVDFDKNDLSLNEVLSSISKIEKNLENINETAVDVIDDFNASTSDKNNRLEDLEEESVEYNESLYKLNTELDKIILEIIDLDKKFESSSDKKSDVYSALSEKIPELESYQSELKSLLNIVNGVLSDVDEVDTSNVAGIVEPVKMEIKPVTAKKDPIHYILPSLIIIAIMFVSMLLSGTLVILEKKSSAFFRNFVTPTSRFMFSLGIFFTTLMIVAIQMVFVLAGSFWLFGANVFASFETVIVLLLLSIAIYTLVGMLIGFFFTTQEMVSLGCIAFGSVFILLSNTILPLEKMPSWFVKFSASNPFILSETLLRKAMLFDGTLVSLVSEIFILIGIVMILLVLLYFVEKIGSFLYINSLLLFNKRKFEKLEKKDLEDIKNKKLDSEVSPEFNVDDMGHKESKKSKSKIKDDSDDENNSDDKESEDDKKGKGRKKFRLFKRKSILDDEKLKDVTSDYFPKSDPLDEFLVASDKKGLKKSKKKLKDSKTVDKPIVKLNVGTDIKPVAKSGIKESPKSTINKNKLVYESETLDELADFIRKMKTDEFLSFYDDGELDDLLKTKFKNHSLARKVSRLKSKEKIIKALKK